MTKKGKKAYLSNLCCVDSPSHRVVCPEMTSCLFLSGTSENSRQGSRVLERVRWNMTGQAGDDVTNEISKML